ncbi:MAG: DUF4974 domain-containing protein [Chitinophagaceae bacterium]
MAQSDIRYWELAEKLLNGTITPDEEKELSAWYNAHQDEPVEVPADFATSEEELSSRMLQYIQQHQQPVAPAVVRRAWWPRVAAAAAILVIIASAAYVWLKPTAQKQQDTIAKQSKQQDIAPGSDKAVLTMPDGSSIVLDDVQNGTLRSQGHLNVVKQDSGRLAYQTSGNAGATEVAYHILSIPRGGQYQLVLADGTKVWLNAASGLRFPTVFTGKERIVELTGEAYFEVAKNAAMPFKVRVNRSGKLGEHNNTDAEITVLGTHFNINAYSDEAAINTTLLEGAVRVTPGTERQAPVVLKPGQQASVAEGVQPVKVQMVDVEDVVAWKEGLFRFKKMNVESIMRQVSRWYNVDVVYEGHPVNQHFNGVITRNVPVSEVIKMLELTKTMHFDVEGDKIVVKEGRR